MTDEARTSRGPQAPLRDLVRGVFADLTKRGRNDRGEFISTLLANGVPVQEALAQARTYHEKLQPTASQAYIRIRILRDFVLKLYHKLAFLCDNCGAALLDERNEVTWIECVLESAKRFLEQSTTPVPSSHLKYVGAVAFQVVAEQYAGVTRDAVRAAVKHECVGRCADKGLYNKYEQAYASFVDRRGVCPRVVRRRGNVEGNQRGVSRAEALGHDLADATGDPKRRRRLLEHLQYLAQALETAAGPHNLDPSLRITDVHATVGGFACAREFAQQVFETHPKMATFPLAGAAMFVVVRRYGSRALLENYRSVLATSLKQYQHRKRSVQDVEDLADRLLRTDGEDFCPRSHEV